MWLETPSARLKNIKKYKVKKVGSRQRHAKNPFAPGLGAGGNPPGGEVSQSLLTRWGRWTIALQEGLGRSHPWA